MDNWNQRFINLAKEYSTWSKDPSSKIGAVAIDPITKRILSGGYNGFPRGIADSDERLNNKQTKYRYMVHAEANMIYNATHSGTSLNGSHMYVWGLPICSECAKAIIQVGIKVVFMPLSTIIIDDTKSDEDQIKFFKWLESWKISEEMFLEAGVEVRFVPDETYFT